MAKQIFLNAVFLITSLVQKSNNQSAETDELDEFSITADF